MRSFSFRHAVAAFLFSGLGITTSFAGCSSASTEETTADGGGPATDAGAGVGDGSNPTADAASPDGGAVAPQQLVMPGVSARGIFDPSLARDGESKRVWMSYSAVDPSVMWPTQNYDVVSTRLAYTDDEGATFMDSGKVLNAAKDIDLTGVLAPPNNAGTWTNEVSSLVYDPGAVASERWKLTWMHYLLINGERRFEHGWLGLKSAATPEALASATEVKLIVGSLYDKANDLAGSPTKPPVAGAPAIALDTALGASLNGCLVFAEPGLMATDAALYLSLVCGKARTDRRVVLLECKSPCTTTSAASWRHVGNLLDSTDAAAFGIDQGFSAPNLARVGGRDVLLVTPERSQPFEGFYDGCLAFPIADLAGAKVGRDAGAPAPIASIRGTAGSFHGACTVDGSLTKAGVLYSQLFVDSPEKFRIYKRGISL